MIPSGRESDCSGQPTLVRQRGSARAGRTYLEVDAVPAMGATMAELGDAARRRRILSSRGRSETDNPV